MSRLEKLGALLERVGDRLNPILVKETRQAMKGKMFIITFMVLLTLAWLTSAIGVLYAGPALEYGSPATFFFAAYFGVLETAIFFIVPIIVFINMLVERVQNTYEMLSISSLTPRQIIRGKLGSGMVMVFVFYSAIAPFIAFCSLLQGFDFATTIFLLCVGILWSLFVCMFSLMISTLAKSRILQVILGIALFIALGLGTIGSYGFMGISIMQLIPFDSMEFRWAFSCTLLVLMSYLLLFQQIAVSRLTFESDNRSTGIRAVCAGQFWMVWIALWVFAYNYTWALVEYEAIIALTTVSAIHWMVLGLLASTENDYISRRVRRNMPVNPILRWLLIPWMPGGHRGYLFLLMHLGALLIIVLPWDWPEMVDNFTIAIVCYIATFVGAGSAIGRIGRKISPEIRPMHVRVLTILIMSTCVFAPYLPPLLGIIDYPSGYSLMEISNPFKTFILIVESPSAPQIATTLKILMITAGVAILLNAKAMFFGIKELAKHDPTPIFDD